MLLLFFYNNYSSLPDCATACMPLAGRFVNVRAFGYLSCKLRVLEKSGMQREGLRRKILPIRGEWIDNYHYPIVEVDKT
jgi:hypothetical protein